VGRLVLIADPGKERAARIGEACSVRGFATRIVANGAEALEAALHSVPDVLVADAGLGVIEASKVAEILRANPRTQHVQFVFLDTELAPNHEAGDSYLVGSHLDEIASRVEALVASEPPLDPDGPPVEGEGEVQGRVAQIPLPDLLQLFHLNRRSGTIELRRRTSEGRETRGCIYLRDGDVVQATAGPVEGEKALFRLLRWADGSFSFRSERVTLAACIQTPTRALLLEGMRQLDEWKRARSSLPPFDAQVALRVASADLPSVVHPLTQEVLLLLETYSQVADIVDHCTFPDYQVLRTLQTLETRGMVEIRFGPPPRPSNGGLFTEAQARRLREWLAAGPSGAVSVQHAKVLLVSPDRQTTQDFLAVLDDLPGMQLESRFRRSKFLAEDLATLGHLRIEDDVGIEFVQVPVLPSFAPLWPVAGYGALATLALLSGPVAKAGAILRPALEILRALPRARLFHLLLVHENEAALRDEIRDNLSLLDEGSLFLVPLEDGRDPAAVLRSWSTRSTKSSRLASSRVSWSQTRPCLKRAKRPNPSSWSRPARCAFRARAPRRRRFSRREPRSEASPSSPWERGKSPPWPPRPRASCCCREATTGAWPRTARASPGGWPRGSSPRSPVTAARRFPS
jgi:CheY-like chemotaxis protein